MQQANLEGGFADAPIQAAQAFRVVMNAMARPGMIGELTGAQPPAPLSVAAGTVLLTLCDPDTPIYLAASHDTPDIRAWIMFHTGAPFADPEGARFAIGRWDELPLTRFAIGTPEYPDRSATLIVETDMLNGTGAQLSGPGIKETATLSLPDIAAFQANAALFPLGLDFMFTCQHRVAALPRTTKVS